MCKLYALLALVGFMQCRSVIPNRVKKEFTLCYDTRDTILDPRIGNKGFYTFLGKFEPIEYLTSNDQTKEYSVHCAFYKDGSFIYNLYSSSKIDSWGLYVVSKDTVKCQFISKPHGVTWWLKGEIWFKLTEKDALQWLYLKYWDGITETEIGEYNSGNVKFNVSLSRFTPLDNLPDPDKSWLKINEWFWCNRDQYKLWSRDSRGQSKQ